jgi:hypothetical protein
LPLADSRRILRRMNWKRLLEITKVYYVNASDRPVNPAEMRVSVTFGPNDIFEISSNNPPDLPDEDDEVHEPQDYTGDYPLESDEGDEE